MPMISVIVPVYKVEKYIERCVKSILDQTYRDFELILVEDGSPDRSGEICDALAQADSRIQVIHKENGGVSSARNMGLDNAEGKYVFFCDADDALPEEALGKMVYTMQSIDTQLVVGDLTNIHIDARKNKIRTTKSQNREYKHISVHDADALYAFWIGNNMLSSCGKLFLRDIISDHNLKFCTEMVVLEDYAFVIDYISKCESVCMIPDEVYLYFSEEGITAASKRSRRDFFDDVLLASKKLDLFVSVFPQKWEEKYRQKTIYPTLKLAYELLWQIETPSYRHRKEKYKRIARAIADETAQKMFSFYKATFASVEYYFMKKCSIVGILVVHGLRRILKPLL